MAADMGKPLGKPLCKALLSFLKSKGYARRNVSERNVSERTLAAPLASYLADQGYLQTVPKRAHWDDLQPHLVRFLQDQGFPPNDRGASS